MDTNEQIIVSPTDAQINRDVFVINDIELMIPPEQIEIRKENLTFHYRTLRSKVATKIPTGNGQATIHFKCVFTDDMYLMMHRLIVEIQNSPFVYIDNRFVRESIVPDWPYAQNMAFTITGISVSPEPNTTNAMALQVDALWFNYFPYMHNFLFREDWQTNWLRTAGDDKLLQSMTIGWLINKQTYERQYYPNVVAEASGAGVSSATDLDVLTNGARSAQLQDQWSVVQNQFVNTENRKTIYEMESQSPGIEFDLLPIPGNMMPARIVNQPRNSRIFVRYINFLQRDALLKNFDIDVRADLLAWEDVNTTSGLFDSLFTAGIDADGLPTVVGLHSYTVPRALRSQWITKMLQTNYGLKLHYHAYKEIRLPQKFTDKMENKKNSAVGDLFARIQGLNDLPEILKGTEGGDPICIPVLGAPFPITSPFGYRTQPVTGAPHTLHEGIDMGAPRSVPILVPESGPNDQAPYVLKVVLDDHIAGNMVVVRAATGDWYFMHMDQVFVTAGAQLNKGDSVGTVGNTGRTTRIDVNGNTNPNKGFHLHVGLVPKGSTNFVDPRPYLQLLVDQQTASQPLFSEPTPDTQSYFDFEETNDVETTPEERQLQNAVAVAQKNLAMTDEEIKELTELLSLLDSEGWSYYDADSTVTNVWKKLFSLEVQNNGINRWVNGSLVPEDFTQAGIVLTSVTGGMSHIVAKIPILGHEFPTQQHLGSIEPEYQLEFAVLDDQSGLDGISAMAQLIQGMRSILQSNSRKFRSVVDGWCLCADTFITRLFGSYNENDFTAVRDGGLYSDFRVQKRLICSNSYEGTMPGNPGLSTLMLGLSETNPYDTERLVSTAPTAQDKDASRAQVLQALYNLNLNPKYKDLILPLLIAEKMQTNVMDQGSPDFGKFTLRQMQGSFTGDTINSSDVFLYREDYDSQTSPPVILMKLDSPDEIDFFRSLGLAVDYYYTDDERQNYVKINPEYLDTYYLQDLQYKLGVPMEETVPSNLQDVSTRLNPAGFPVALYDISQLIQQYPELATIPFDKLFNYYGGVDAVLRTGSRMFAEHEVGGVTKEYAVNQLYGLPARTDMWKAWECYLEEFVKVSNLSTASTAIAELHKNPNWPLPGAGNKTNWADPLPEIERALYAEMAQQYFGFYHSATAMAYDVTVGPATDLMTGIVSGFSTEVDLATIYRTKHEAAITRLVNRYMTNFPAQVDMPDYMKQQYQAILGNLLGNVSENERGKVPALDSLHDAFNKNAYSCGNITYDFVRIVNDNPVWQSETPGAEKSGRALRGGVLGSLAFPAALSDSLGKASGTGAPFSALSALYNMTTLAAAQTGMTDTLYPLQTIGNTLNTPFEYPVDQSSEELKVKYIKSLLAAFADGILGDYGLLEALGLGHLLFRDANRDYVGMECYPDLALPAHPYYGSITQTYPDFYMWNIYEDGGALGPEMVAQIQEKVESVLDNCYTSMKRMEKGDNYDERRDTIIPETGIDDPMNLKTQISAEGTDGNDEHTAMGSPFYPTSMSSKSVEDWKKAAAGSNKSKRIYSDKPSDQLEGVRLANTEGLFGIGGGSQYPRRAGKGTYDELNRQYQATNQLFGSREGYMNTGITPENTPEIHSSIQGTPLQRSPESGHFFDPASLKRLAADSSKDLISQKMSLKRAFPTFKLYFIEEDEFETRFLNFDDFYSYNAIKEMNVVQSRKLAADTAIITLQNIAGTLDGTRRNAIVDLDYYSSFSLKQKMDSHADTDDSIIGGDPLTAGTQSDQPFGAVVLRPGLNVQLRMGFSNDPNTLEVMLSGRIVDVTWNKTGDLAEILVQSFGTELTQAVKGTSRDENYRTFYTTHELLGAMMLEPEVVHFGRWEFGQQFQIGEAKDYKLDFTEYSREGWIGKFGVTNALSNFIMNHPYITMGVAVGITAANFLPFGRVFSGSKLLTGIASKIGLPLVEGGAGYEAILAGTRTGEEALQLSERTNALRIAGQSLEALNQAAKRTLGNPEFDAAVANQMKTVSEEFFQGVAANNNAQAAGALAKLENFIQGSVFKSKWMVKPWIAPTLANAWTSVGMKPIGTAVSLFSGTPIKLTAAAFGSAISLDLFLNFALRPIYNYTIGGARKFFARTNAQLFLTPQDDNLYPPHPKDYMTLDRTLTQKAAQLGLHTSSMILTNSSELGLSAYRFIYPDEYISKKVVPESCQYQIVSTDIWNIFHEMSLRHPGWVYGARPYGTAFRYTMFFGLPAQRYWARGESNAFVTRANMLRRFLDNRSGNFQAGELLTENEFINLYGSKVLQQLKDQIERTTEFADPEPRAVTVPPFQGVVDLGIQPLVTNPQEERVKKAILNNQMASIAIQEYLRAVQIRFQPFRRYHLVTSDRDLVWNGIMGSEQAVVNAVDVTYFPDPTVRADDFAAQTKTAVFKAHSFIPEYKLRIAPVREYNCKGYGMAMRYAMGSLLHNMKDMYRGEIITLGNPRIRPWDICVLLDSYNDMVGPVEVEQVVHTFSHETGYLTEIKPSAVVFANEISGWPLVEAMKLFSLAVHDIHARYAGIHADAEGAGNDPGGTLAGVGAVLDQIKHNTLKAGGFIAAAAVAGPIAGLAGYYAGNNVNRGPKFDSYIEEKYKRFFGDMGPQMKTMYGEEPPPNLDVVDGFMQDLMVNVNRAGSLAGIVGSSLTLTGSVVSATGLYKEAKALTGASGFSELLAKSGDINYSALNKAFLKNPMHLAAGAALLTGTALAAAGFGAPLILNQIDFPGAAFLVGGTMLFLQCLRNDALIVVPLTKNGNPIIAGLAYNDPQMLWKTFRGTINRYAIDTIQGTTDMLSLYKRYGSAVWERINDPKLGVTADQAFGIPDQPSLDSLTGE